VWEYEVEIKDCHVLFQVDNRRVLLDTGSPHSIGEGTIEFCGQSYPLTNFFGAVNIHGLCEDAGFHFDALIGGDLLANHVVDIDPQRKSLTIDGPTPENGYKSVDMRLVQNVPVVDIEIDGENLSAAIDTGASICYARSEMITNLPQAGEHKDFYPGFGRFNAIVRQSNLQLGECTVDLNVAELPAFLDGLLLMFNIDAIVGNNMLLRNRICINYIEKSVSIYEGADNDEGHNSE